MTIRRVVVAIAACAAVLLAAPTAQAQVQTGSITGAVSDTSGAVLPGVNVTLTGERLIGGAQSMVTDATGAYRFDRLVPGAYNAKFELQGFKTVERADIRINAAFVATISPRLEVGSLTETITVTGESPTVDVRSTVQQTVMSQEILEGVPTGRDPWSLAKLIPGVQVATYDVGGTKSMQQSSMSAHGSNTADVSYNIDGATVNWPGGNGGATMIYYDQGMFEEVNYMTSAVPAEVLAGGVSINMVTKIGSNQWKGNLRYSYSNDNLQSANWAATQRVSPTFLGNPTKKIYDFNVSGGGAVMQNRIWVNGTVRKWVVNNLVSARNDDGSQAIDDNDLKNYSGKAVGQITPNNKVSVSYLWNNKIRGHRRDTNDKIPDIASVVQGNPVQTTQAKYTGIKSRLVFESNFSVMDGQTDYTYQPNTAPGAVRIIDTTLAEVYNASTREEHQPNSRHQFDNIFSYSMNKGGEHLMKGGVQWGRLYYSSDYSVLGDHWLIYNNRVPTAVRQYNTPLFSKNVAKVLGLFFQDSWSVNRLTLNLGGRWDKYTGSLPDQSAPGGTFGTARTVTKQDVIDHSIAVWRAGASYDVTGNGRTALKASYSRYGLQVGIDRVTVVNPLTVGTRDCPWSDPNGDRVFQPSEVNVATCPGFSGGLNTSYAAGVKWPHSDEVTAGIETELPGAIRVGAMFYYRTNRDQIGQRNTLQPTSAYTAFTVNVPNGPGGTVTSPAPTTVTAYNIASSVNALVNNVRDNEPYLDTDYKGIEFTATKRFSKKWQMQAGLTFGQNKGGVTNGTDLNDPNVTQPEGIIGDDSKTAFRLSGSYVLPFDISLAGSLIANNGYPYQSTYNISRAAALVAGTTLTRASQTVPLSARGDERFGDVTMLDIRLSRSFRFGSRSFSPQVDFFNITNADQTTSHTVAVGGSYLLPQGILSPRTVRVGFSLNF